MSFQRRVRVSLLWFTFYPRPLARAGGLALARQAERDADKMTLEVCATVRADVIMERLGVVHPTSTKSAGCEIGL
jgi:hypothetical protein